MEWLKRWSFGDVWMTWKREWCEDLGKECSGKGTSKCKELDLANCLDSLRNYKMARMADAEWASGTCIGRGRPHSVSSWGPWWRFQILFQVLWETTDEFQPGNEVDYCTDPHAYTGCVCSLICYYFPLCHFISCLSRSNREKLRTLWCMASVQVWGLAFLLPYFYHGGSQADDKGDSHRGQSLENDGMGNHPEPWSNHTWCPPYPFQMLITRLSSWRKLVQVSFC